MAGESIHTKLVERGDIASAVRFVNDSINGCGFDFREDSDGLYHSLGFAMSKESDHSIIVLASFDFAYYHNVELVFYEAGYNTIPPGGSWWDHWTKDQIELSDESFPDGFEFRFNVGTKGDYQYIIHAKGFSYHLEIISNRR